MAPGSRVNSSYEIWTGQEFKSVTVKWQAEADPALFAGEEIVLEYSKSGFNYRYPRGAWVQINYDANASVITIVDAMKWSEAQKASWVAPGKDQIWLLNGTKNLRKTNNDQFFQEMPGSGSRIAIGPSGKIYGIDSFTNVIYKFVDEAWESYTGDRAKRLAAGPKSLFTIDLFNNIWQRDHENDSWIPLNDKSSEIAIGPKGDLWSIYLNGDVYERVNGDWIKRGIKASRISVGPEGPWVVDKQGSAYKYMGSNRWENIAGGVKEVAVRENGEVYGIAPGNFLMKFQGEYFRPLEK
ncbi:MAG: hypothetical protein CMP10_21695 [Zetaproteobacteria bacterium]|nr:hypothetical protein [Pseudobdellovibrionaceae bacterium]